MTNGIIYCTLHDGNRTIRNWFVSLQKQNGYPMPGKVFAVKSKTLLNPLHGKTPSRSMLHFRWSKYKSTSLNQGLKS